MVKDINKNIIEGGDNGNGDLLDTNCAHPAHRYANVADQGIWNLIGMKRNVLYRKYKICKCT